MNTRRNFLASLAIGAPLLFLPTLIKPAWSRTLIPVRRYEFVNGRLTKSEYSVTPSTVRRLFPPHEAKFICDGSGSLGLSAHAGCDWLSYYESYGQPWR